MDEITNKNYKELTKYKNILYEKYYFNKDIDFTKIDDVRAREIEKSFDTIFKYTSCKSIDVELVEKELGFIENTLERLLKEHS